MTKFGLVILIFLLAGECNAQNYFVFIDAGNRQPFYVRLDSQFYSSSADGHIILSRLRDSLYDITIGFPGQTAREQHYEFGMRGKDQAFELRDHGGEAPVLFDLQANEWVRLHTRGGGADEFRSTGSKKDDAFSRMMAGVVHDTAVLYNTYGMEQELVDNPAPAKKQAATQALAAAEAIVDKHDSITDKPDAAVGKHDTTIEQHDAIISKHDTTMVAATIVGPPSHDSSVAFNPPPAKTVDSIAQSIPTTTTITSPTTTTASPTTTLPPTPPPYTDTPGQLYRPVVHQPIPDTAGKLYRPIAGTTEHKAAPVVDSVGTSPLFRPLARVTKLSERRTPRSVRLVYTDQSQGKKTDTVIIIIPVDTVHATLTRSHGPNGSADSPTLGPNAVFRPLTPPATPAAGNARPASQVDSQRHPAKGEVAYVNSDCHNFANDLDVDKLRAKMLEAVKDDDRIAVARKAFKVKCFYTRYIRALSEIFTTDAAKYRFLEAAWPFAADEHFHELANLLADPVYAGKFRTLTGHP
jgi:hypothetical protein